MITHPGGAGEPGTIILMEESSPQAQTQTGNSTSGNGNTANAPTPSSDHTGHCCNSANLMCDADRFFQVTGDSLDGAGAGRESDQLATPKSP
ncbi:unnamed protein product [Callosobruchus maculatus]|uniref:Uncharacterized protein n=1 Tax=Callosobruchus maculatus TaxID=64391 RepID=A0A653DT80_CALMS|nr:unnamed protein product [Callosobruchus maculatus]